MNNTQITFKDLNKKVKKFKAKLMLGKIISFSMLIILALALSICAILVAMGYTGEESLLIYWIFIVVGSIAALCVYPGIFALIRLPHTIKLFKRIKTYEKNDMIRDMVFDLETSEIVNFGDKAILSDKYLFFKNLKKLPIPCNEIYWVYTSTFKNYTSIKLGTKNDGVISYSGIETSNPRFSTILENAVLDLQERTDNDLILNYSVEKEAKYKELIGK